MDYKYSYSEILSLITQCKKEGLITKNLVLYLLTNLKWEI